METFYNNRILSILLLQCLSDKEYLYLTGRCQVSFSPFIFIIQLSKVFSLKVKAFLYKRDRRCWMTFLVRAATIESHVFIYSSFSPFFFFSNVFFPSNNKKTSNQEQSSNLCCSIRDDFFFVSLFICLPLMMFFHDEKIHRKL